MVSEAKQAALLARATLNLVSAVGEADGRPLLGGIVQYDLRDDTATNSYEGRLGLTCCAPDAAGDLVPSPPTSPPGRCWRS